jgi:hypothetical protein
MRKNYQLFLCESFYTTSSGKSPTFIEKPVCELGSSESSFSGQAYNVEFYTKIDGTHELTFNLPRYYFDEFTGKRKKNELVELVVNKSHIELTKTTRSGKKKTFYMVVNNRKDKEEKGVFSYEYSCTDVYIEELSKNGYSVNFDTDVEGNGLGDIHHFAEVIEEKSGWTYAIEKNDKLPEYKIDEVYDPFQMRMNEVRTVVPVFEVEYIPELKRYCQALDMYRVAYHNNPDGAGRFKYGHRIYCYDDSKTVTSSAVKNLLHNGDDFTDTIGWQSFRRISDGNGTEEDPAVVISNVQEGTSPNVVYKMTLSSSENFLLLNDTAAQTGVTIQANKPYIFEHKSENLTITKVEIYAKNPCMYPKEVATCVLSLDNGFKSEAPYVIKSKFAISNPYFVFHIKKTSGKDGKITSILFFEAIAENQENQLEILKTFTQGKKLNKDTKLFIYPESSTFQAYTEHKVLYFYRTNYAFLMNSNNNSIAKEQKDLELEKEEIEYLDFEKDILKKFPQDWSTPDSEECWSPYYTSDYFGQKKTYEFEPTIEGLEIALGRDLCPDDLKTIYYNSKDGKYYEYYETEDFSGKGYSPGRALDYALLGDGRNEKRRTYSVSKSNFFNIIQDLAELFKVWPVFELIRNPDTNIVTRQFYFREGAVRDNFAGFHRDVNLVSIVRDSDSNDVVTKMFVEDQENNLAEDGFVTIRTAPLNPWGENYYYNFGYYIDQKLLNVFDGGQPKVEKDKDILYQEVGKLNGNIRNLNKENIELKMELNNLEAKQTSLTVQISSAQERVASMEADLAAEEWIPKDNGLYDVSYKVSSPVDRENMEASIAKYTDEITKKTAELKTVEDNIGAIEEKYKENNNIIQTSQKEKESLISDFEEIYRPYIKEGVWFDNSYIDNNTYYLDSLKVMQTSSRPKYNWSISVIDGSVATELEDYEFEVGDKTLLVDNEFFGVESNANQSFTFEVLIAGIREGLDDATKNTIEVRNYLTSFEDLFQRISAATQTLELNEQTYNKSDYFTADGKLSADLLQRTLDQNNFILANASDNSYILDHTGLSMHAIDNPTKQLRIIAEGLFVSNSRNLQTGQPLWRTGITADGISADLITAGAIDTANIRIYSGSQPLQVWNAVGLTSYKRDTTDKNSKNYGKADTKNFVRLDQFGLYVMKGNDNFETDGNGNPWFYSKTDDIATKEIESNALCSITRNGLTWNLEKELNDGSSIKLGYIDDSKTAYGLVIKSKGNEVVRLANNNKNMIAGWTIEPGVLKATSPDNEKISFYLSTNKKEDQGFWIKAQKLVNGDQECIFGVKKDGTLIATGAILDGNITATSGTIGGFKIGAAGKTAGTDCLSGYSNALSCTIFNEYEFPLYEAGLKGAKDSGNLAFYVKENWYNKEKAKYEVRNNFYVKYNGDLYARNAEIHGKIVATSGKIGGCTIDEDGKLWIPAANISGTLSANQINANGITVTNGHIKSLSVDKLTTGTNNNKLTFGNIHATGGSIAGWTFQHNKNNEELSSKIKYDRETNGQRKYMAFNGFDASLACYSDGITTENYGTENERGGGIVIRAKQGIRHYYNARLFDALQVPCIEMYHASTDGWYDSKYSWIYMWKGAVYITSVYIKGNQYDGSIAKQIS